MNIRIIAGVASAALMGIASTSPAAVIPVVPASLPPAGSVEQAVDNFYAARGGAPLWLRGGDNSAATALMGILQRAPLDGFASGPALALQAQTQIGRASVGDATALASADRLLSTAWVLYVEALQTPPAGMVYADSWVQPRRDQPELILARAAGAKSLASHVRSVSNVNPLYARIRDAAWAEIQSGGAPPDPRVLTSLERIRDMPFQKKYVVVDAAGARLYMIENGEIADSMKVIVGKAGEGTQTPMLASTIYYATLNPYWHVSADMVRSLIAKNVLDLGLGYLRTHGYQVMPADPNDNSLLDPAKVNWRAVAAGRETVRVRQLPGPANSMGTIKFPFPNAWDIYLHDTPGKSLFAQDDRDLSHGCIRLEDAPRLGRWLMGRNPKADSKDPEQNELLPTPTPIYVTYLTAQVKDGQLSYVDDIYARDTPQVAAASN